MPYWAVARTAPHHERLAFESVALAGFKTFVPRIRVRVGPQWRTTPLFGCYFFVRVVDRWRILERTVAVLNVVKFGAAPARCPDEEIAAATRPLKTRYMPTSRFNAARVVPAALAAFHWSPRTFMTLWASAAVEP